ncbi:PEP-CTERM sorting domain-containing protein [Adhaeretor mobilis]|uniref:PEP-CTERM protein-sorting domain-containing protein n=1 Tax=Adhaeretor mobilis TaxID=1930276 RepID=A0A517MUE2_9BACT|nr:PEP-CTERM sorting domain-containing protein [Adhaeretor mobilis]QDS98506.1 hypothetical protein HG15A2_17860 [Adhaeretor mobilis]
MKFITSSIPAVAAFFLLLPISAEAQTTIIGGSIGNGDFEASESPSDPDAVTGPISFENTTNWFHANNTGPNETINFTNDSQTGGSSQANSRAGMPFQGRFQINDTPYTIGGADEVFNVSYDFGAGGGPSNWTGDEVMRIFLFTSTAAVDGDTTVNDITEIGGDNYDIGRANGDPQWTTRSAPAFYTSTAGDIGSTVYFGMEFQDPISTNLLFPRIDVINLTVGGMTGTPGDLDDDGDVDGADFLEFQRTDGSAAGLTAFQDNYGTVPALASVSAVPEPSSLLLLALTATTGLTTRQRCRG